MPETPSVQLRREERHLIEQAKRGDKHAFGKLYQRHVEAVYRYVFGRVRDKAVAEDITAQVFLKALEGLARYQPGDSPFAAWLYAIARARVVDHWRQQGRRPQAELIDALPSDEPQPGEFVDNEIAWNRAIDVIARLTDDQQDVILLRFIGEMSLSEVADILGKSVEAVKAIQHRALASIARLLQGETAHEQDG